MMEDVPAPADDAREPAGVPAEAAGAAPTGASTPWSAGRPASGRAVRTRFSVRGGRAGRLLGLLAVLTVAGVGASIGWALAPGSTVELGPLTVRVDVDLGTDPGASVQLPPVGEVSFDTHRGLLAVRASVVAVDVGDARSLISDPRAVTQLTASTPGVLRGGMLRAAAWSAGCALLGAAVAGGAVYRRPRAGGRSAAVAAAPLVLVAAVAALTFEPAALGQPRFTGLLSQAPYLAGQGQGVAQRLESYRSGVADIVQSVTTLYTLTDELPVLPRGGQVTTVLHISDIHLNPQAFDLTDQLVEQFGVDVVVDTGDITTWGTAAESATLSRIGRLGVPYVFVRGNHDSVATQEAVAAQAGAVVLDRTAATVAGLTFAGIGDAQFTPAAGRDDDATALEAAGRSATELAEVVRATDRVGDPVDVALIHNPGRLDPLFGHVPLILSGHYHERIVRTDEPTGTQVMVQGTTGGAGVTAGALRRLEEGDPIPLQATLLYFAAVGERAGSLVAYDDVTVGGLGLSSVTIERTVPDRDPEPPTPSPPEPDVPSAVDVPAAAPADPSDRRRSNCPGAAVRRSVCS
jgi:predicted MPP superfamily phosphohydrolase